MLSGNKVGIVIIAYNNPDFIVLQAQKIKKFCKDDFQVVVIDNSIDKSASEGIKYHAEINGCEYMKTNASSVKGSDSHSFAANLSYFRIKGKYDYLFYIDHDCFPVIEFSVIEILGDKLMAGLGQHKNGKDYFWPGCLMWNNKDIDQSFINFSPSAELGLDTGGGFYEFVEANREKCIFFNEEHCQNPSFNKSFYNFYCMINNGMFMHFVNGSNWNDSPENEERINSLKNILQEKTK